MVSLKQSFAKEFYKRVLQKSFARKSLNQAVTNGIAKSLLRSNKFIQIKIYCYTLVSE
jgi:hypothetical protein